MDFEKYKYYYESKFWHCNGKKLLKVSEKLRA